MKQQSKLIKLQVTEQNVELDDSIVMENKEVYIELLSFQLDSDRLFIRACDMHILKKITTELQQVHIAQLTARVAQLQINIT